MITPRDPESVNNPQRDTNAGSGDSASEMTAAHMTRDIAPQPFDEPLPDVPGYEIYEEIGRGGMGVVYKARQITLNRIVALKMIRGGPIDADDRERFKNEVEAVARLQHRNVVQVYDVGRHEGRPYCALEFVAGGSLDRLLKTSTIPPREAASIVEQAARGIHAAHQAGVIHRDLKPGNILLGSDAEGSTIRVKPSPIPKISDFGLAKFLHQDAANLTQTGQILGTPSYMAPEQAEGRGSDIGPCTDIYALGAILYELLAGRPPFKGSNITDTLAHVISQDPVAPRRLQPGLPRDLETICLKCLHKETWRRYSSAEELADDLKRFHEGHSILARPVGQGERAAKWVRRNPLVAALSTLVVVVALAGLVLVLLQWNEAVGQRNRAEDETRAKTDALEDRERALAQTEKARKDAEDAKAEAARERDAARLALGLERALRHAGRIKDAVRLLRDGRPGDALEMLDGCAAEQRGWEWNWMRESAGKALPRQLYGASDDARHVIFSNDSRLVAAVGPNDAVVQVWEAADGKPLHLLGGTSNRMMSPRFSGDGKHLLTRASVLFGDGKSSHQLRLWDLSNAQPVFTFDKPGEFHGFIFGAPETSVVQDANGNWLGLSQKDWKWQLWDLRAGKTLPVLPAENKIYLIALCPDGRTFAVVGMTGGFGDRVVELRDLTNGATRHNLAGHTASVRQLIFSPDGRRLATLTHRQQTPENVCELKVWDIETGKMLRSFTEPAKSEYREVAFSGDGSQLALVVALDGPRFENRTAEVRFCDVTTGKTIALVRTTTAASPLVALSPDGKRLAISLFDSSLNSRIGSVRIIDIAGGREVFQGQAPVGRLSGLRFSPDGKTLACLRGASPVGRILPGDLLLWDVATPGDGTIALSGHADAVTAVALTKNERILASAGKDASVRLWKVGTGEMLRTFEGQAGAVGAVAFSTDDERLAVGGEDATLRIFNVRNGKLLKSMPAFDHKMTGLAVHPGKPWIASSGQDGTVRIWDVEEEKVLRTLDMPAALKGRAAFSSVAFSPDGAFVVAGASISAEQAEVAPVCIWETETGKSLRVLQAHRGIVHAAAFSPTGGRIATAGADRLIKVWDAASGRMLFTLAGHADAVLCVRFGEDGRRLYSSGADQTLRVWDAEVGQELLSLPTGGRPPALVSGTRLMAAGVDRTVKLWDAPTTPERFTFQGPTTGSAALALSPDGATQAVMNVGRADPVTHRLVEPAQLRLWDVALGREKLSVPVVFLDGETQLAFLRGGEQVAGIVWDARQRRSQIVVWETATLQPVLHINASDQSFRRLAASPDGKLLAVSLGGNDPMKTANVVELYDAATGKRVKRLTGAKAALNGLAFSPDGSRLAAAGMDYVVHIWDVAGGNLVQTLSGHRSSVVSVGFSPDGTRVVSGSTDAGAIRQEVRVPEVKVWNVASGKVEMTLSGHQGRIVAVAFSPDGTRIASGADDRRVRIWDSKSGRCLRILDAHRDRVTSIAFHPDGRLFSASHDNTVKVFDLHRAE